MCKYHEVAKVVEPKIVALNAAQAELKARALREEGAGRLGPKCTGEWVGERLTLGFAHSGWEPGFPVAAKRRFDPWGKGNGQQCVQRATFMPPKTCRRWR